MQVHLWHSEQSKHVATCCAAVGINHDNNSQVCQPMLGTY